MKIFGLSFKLSLLSLLFVLNLPCLAQEPADEVKALTSQVLADLKPSDTEMKKWERTIFGIVYYEACLEGNEIACAMVSKQDVIKAIKSVQTEEWKKAPVGIQAITVDALFKLEKTYKALEKRNSQSQPKTSTDTTKK